MPVGDVSLGESPGYTFRGKTLLDVAVLGDVEVVIEIDKLIIENLPIDSKDDTAQ
jgi:hypothetical protein